MLEYSPAIRTGCAIRCLQILVPVPVLLTEHKCNGNTFQTCQLSCIWRETWCLLHKKMVNLTSKSLLDSPYTCLIFRIHACIAFSHNCTTSSRKNRLLLTFLRERRLTGLTFLTLPIPKGKKKCMYIFIRINYLFSMCRYFVTNSKERSWNKKATSSRSKCINWQNIHVHVQWNLTYNVTVISVRLVVVYDSSLYTNWHFGWFSVQTITVLHSTIRSFYPTFSPSVYQGMVCDSQQFTKQIVMTKLKPTKFEAKQLEHQWYGLLCVRMCLSKQVCLTYYMYACTCTYVSCAQVSGLEKQSFFSPNVRTLLYVHV